MRYVVLLLFSAAHVTLAQVAHPRAVMGDSSVPRIMAHVGRRATAPWLRQILRQSDQRQPRAKLDELADSLSSRAIATHATWTTDPDGVRDALSTVGLLALAGNRNDPLGTPYEGALDRLIRIQREGSLRSVRSAAVAAMLGVVDRDRALTYLRTTAQTTDSSAFDAVNALIVDANGGSWSGPKPNASQQEESKAVLKNLYSASLVKDRRAAQALETWVSFTHQNWKRP